MRLPKTRLTGFIAGCLLATLIVAFVTELSLKDKFEPQSPQSGAATAPPISSKSAAPDDPASHTDQKADQEQPTAISSPVVEPAVAPPELALIELDQPPAPASVQAAKSPNQQSSLEAPVESKTSAEHNRQDQPENSAAKVENFWGPFMSKSRAQKFADYIGKIINRPMQLSQAENGYSIGFNYHTQAEKLSIKREIQTKAGIDLGIRDE